MTASARIDGGGRTAARIAVCDEPWPAEALETLGRCPLCGAAERVLLFEDLCDTIFFVAPGRWTLWRCLTCGNGYLDPRPDAASIGRAYEDYHTHEAPWVPAPPATRLQRLRAGLANGYRNRRYGTRFSPAYGPGYWIGRLLSPLAEPSDVAYRFLERRSGDPPRPSLLDVGCGGGAFVAAALEAGWQAAGIDFDSKAVEGARQRGLDVSLGGLETVADEAERFDAVTLSHVIEHLHDPAGALRTIRRILKPGGRLYVETPNLDSIGRRRYGRHWRGLEPPRHLVLFNRRGLAELLARSGFEAIRFRRIRSALAGLGLLSARIAAGLDPNEATAGVRGPGLLDRLRSSLSRNGTEFMTFTAEKPRS